MSTKNINSSLRCQRRTSIHLGDVKEGHQFIKTSRQSVGFTFMLTTITDFNLIAITNAGKKCHLCVKEWNVGQYAHPRRLPSHGECGIINLVFLIKSPLCRWQKMFFLWQRCVLIGHFFSLTMRSAKALCISSRSSKPIRRFVAGLIATPQPSGSPIRNFMIAVLKIYCILFDFTQGIDNNGVHHTVSLNNYACKRWINELKRAVCLSFVVFFLGNS